MLNANEETYYNAHEIFVKHSRRFIYNFQDCRGIGNTRDVMLYSATHSTHTQQTYHVTINNDDNIVTSSA